MPHVVAKPFKTADRRFAVGVVVSDADINGATSFDDWVAGGFIASDDPVVVEPAPIAAPAPVEQPAPVDHEAEHPSG